MVGACTAGAATGGATQDSGGTLARYQLRAGVKDLVASSWLSRLHAGDYPPAVSLRPGGDHPERALVVTGLPRVPAILDRIAVGIVTGISAAGGERAVGPDCAPAAVKPGLYQPRTQSRASREGR